MTTAPAEQVLTAGGVLRDRKMATYLAAATLSGIGTFLQAAVLGKQVYDITDSTVAIGLLGLVEFAPALLLVPLTGSAADRFDRRHIVGIGLAAEVLTSMLYFAYARSNPTSAVPIFLIAVLFGTARDGAIARAQRARDPAARAVLDAPEPARTRLAEALATTGGAAQ